MRLPFLQVTQETWTKAKMLARVLGISRQHAFALVCDLWAWALDVGPSDEPPTGIVTSPRATEMMAGALEWTGEPAALANAFVDVGLIEWAGDTIRVRGMDRYRAAWEKAAKERERKQRYAAKRAEEFSAAKAESDAEATRKGRGSDAEFRPKTQTQTQTQTQKSQKPPPARKSEPERVKTATQPEARPLFERLNDVFKKHRGSDYTHSFPDEQAIRGLLTKASGDEAEIIRRYELGLRRRRFPLITTWVDLNQRWNDCAAPEPAAATAFPAKVGRATNAEKDWDKATVNLTPNGDIAL